MPSNIERRLLNSFVLTYILEKAKDNTRIIRNLLGKKMTYTLRNVKMSKHMMNKKSQASAQAKHFCS